MREFKMWLAREPMNVDTAGISLAAYATVGMVDSYRGRMLFIFSVGIRVSRLSVLPRKFTKPQIESMTNRPTVPHKIMSFAFAFLSSPPAQTIMNIPQMITNTVRVM